MDTNGTALSATVFSSFAAKDSSSDRMQISRSSSGDTLAIYANAVDESTWFNAASIGDELTTYVDVGVTKESATKATMSFTSGK